MFYYKQVIDNEIVSVEAKIRASKSPHFSQATKAEYDTFIASLPVVVPEPARDYGKEIDAINERLKVVEKR